MKQEKGITLIALVITIIVLLILAGVTIALLTSDGNIPEKAKQAAVETAISDTKSIITTTAASALADWYDVKYANGTNVAAAEKQAIGDAANAGAYVTSKITALSSGLPNKITLDTTSGIKIKYDNTDKVTVIVGTTGSVTYTDINN